MKSILKRIVLWLSWLFMIWFIFSALEPAKRSNLELYMNRMLFTVWWTSTGEKIIDINSWWKIITYGTLQTSWGDIYATKSYITWFNYLTWEIDPSRNSVSWNYAKLITWTVDLISLTTTQAQWDDWTYVTFKARKDIFLEKVWIMRETSWTPDISCITWTLTDSGWNVLVSSLVSNYSLWWVDKFATFNYFLQSWNSYRIYCYTDINSYRAPVYNGISVPYNFNDISLVSYSAWWAWWIVSSFYTKELNKNWISNIIIWNNNYLYWNIKDMFWNNYLTWNLSNYLKLWNNIATYWNYWLTNNTTLLLNNYYTWWDAVYASVTWTWNAVKILVWWWWYWINSSTIVFWWDTQWNNTPWRFAQEGSMWAESKNSSVLEVVRNLSYPFWWSQSWNVLKIVTDANSIWNILWVYKESTIKFKIDSTWDVYITNWITIWNNINTCTWTILWTIKYSWDNFYWCKLSSGRILLN